MVEAIVSYGALRSVIAANLSSKIERSCNAAEGCAAMRRDPLAVCRTIKAMRYAFDESGTFVFPAAGFDSCALGAVACPDSALPFLDTEFARVRAEHNLAEIHGVEMTPTALHAVCALVGASDILWAAVYTDSRLLPLPQQEDFRRRQVQKADEGISNSKILADDDERMAEAVRTRNRIRLSTRVGIAEYLEFLILFPRAVGDILAGSLRAFCSVRWDATFCTRSRKVRNAEPGHLQTTLSCCEWLLQLRACRERRRTRLRRWAAGLGRRRR